MQDKVCIVTGGANGIGRCIVEAFLSQGARVAIIDTDAEAGQRLIKRFSSSSLFFFHGDVAEVSVLDRFIPQVLERFSKVDVLVNNACISRGGLRDCSYDAFNYILRLGVTAPFYLTQKLIPYFATGASVVNLCSTRARMSQPNTESYTAAKGGILALTHAMSTTLAGKVRVNAISPGWIDTGAYHGSEPYTPNHSPSDCFQHPVGRVGTPDDIAQMVLFLCSEKAGFITGENITIDGGMSKQMIYHGDHGWSYQPE